MRYMILTLLMLIAVPLSAASATGAEIGEDGLHKQPWFTTSFKDVGEDITTAQEEGKRLAIIFEQRGCIYCKKLHETVFSDPKVRDYIKENFVVIQYNLFGDEEVTDLDGEVLSEKKRPESGVLSIRQPSCSCPRRLPMKATPGGPPCPSCPVHLARELPSTCSNGSGKRATRAMSIFRNTMPASSPNQNRPTIEIRFHYCPDVFG